MRNLSRREYITVVGEYTIKKTCDKRNAEDRTK